MVKSSDSYSCCYQLPDYLLISCHTDLLLRVHLGFFVFIPMGEIFWACHLMKELNRGQITSWVQD